MNITQIRSAVAGMVGLLLVGSWFGYAIASRNIRSNAIGQECAHYDTRTGEFKWGQQ